MNRRTLKKHCARAMETLIAKYGYQRRYFVRSEGDETVYAPSGMERRFVRHDFLQPGPLKGTWLYYCADYFGETDHELPICILRDAEITDSMSDEEFQRIAEAP
jgi:hypothetical protein